MNRRRLLLASVPAALALTPLTSRILGASALASGAPADTGSTLWYNAFIAIVWPQDGKGNGTSVVQSRTVNVAIWPTTAVSCTYNPTNFPGSNGPSNSFPLWRAKDNDVAEIVARQGTLVQRTMNGATFPTVEFDNIPADLVDDPTARYSFTIGMMPWGSGFLFGSNVWVHAIDARTFAPRPVVPTGIQTTAGPVDARIQIVWPHDRQGNYAPVSRAPFVNIAVFTATGINGAVGFTNFWTHAADARTYLPTPQPPPACTP